jgi:hypothetical protein
MTLRANMSENASSARMIGVMMRFPSDKRLFMAGDLMQIVETVNPVR